jgi:hypothetical protein
MAKGDVVRIGEKTSNSPVVASPPNAPVYYDTMLENTSFVVVNADPGMEITNDWSDPAVKVSVKGHVEVFKDSKALTVGVEGYALGDDSYGVRGFGLHAGVQGMALIPDGYGVDCVGRFRASGRTFVGAPNTALKDDDLDDLREGSLSFWLDEFFNDLKVQVRYSDGTVKVASINLSTPHAVGPAAAGPDAAHFVSGPLEAHPTNP